MQLSAICKKAGHTVRLIDLHRFDLKKTVEEFKPKVVGYSAMSTNIELFRKCDEQIRDLCNKDIKNKIFRIMGGPHPTYSPEVIEELKLDAICQGDGDNAFPEFLKRIEQNRNFENIKNIGLTKEGAKQKELFNNLDLLPYIDRECIYEISPHYRACGHKTFFTSRGCPYHCTYCFNHAYNNMFKNCGKILRRRSVDNLLDEVETVIEQYPPVRLVRFCDDTFVHKKDAWFEEFVEKYKKRIKKPFYCLMRSNTLTEETASLLAEAGCCSISMAMETGNESVRNDLLKREIKDDVLVRSYKLADKYKINVLANTMLGLPGTSLEDDFKSLEFAKEIHPAAPTFVIFCPFPNTALYNKTLEMGLIDQTTHVYQSYSDLSVLNCYSPAEKKTQLRMAFLGTLFCCMPMFLSSIIKKLIFSNLNLTLCLVIGKSYVYYRIMTRIYRHSIPLSPFALFYLFIDTLKIWGPVKKLNMKT